MSSRSVLYHFLLPLVLSAFGACTFHGGYNRQLLQADSLLSGQPAKALSLLDSLYPDAQNWAKAQRIRYYLLRAKAQNKSYQSVEDDTLLRQVADYYDRHGQANDRLAAHYLLGCAYRDKGESTLAVDCFQKAIVCVDTTAPDCDFRTLSAVYSQMADQFHHQLLFTYEIGASQQAIHYAYLAHDTLSALQNMEFSAGTYILMNRKDSAEILIKKAISAYQAKGTAQDVLRGIVILMHLYAEDTPLKQADLKRLIDYYDSNVNLVGERQRLFIRQHLFYYYKGKYYENTGILDSAEFYYRKVPYSRMPYTMLNAYYKGMLNVSAHRHQADSVEKYAKLYCIANDSSIAIQDKELTAQLAASYQYRTIQKQAAEKKCRSGMQKELLWHF